MKKFKAIVPALAMLLVSAVLLGTSTFAWFSMNDEVSVSGLQITAKSDQVYLLIGTENDKAAIRNDVSTTAQLTVTTEESTLKPVEPIVGENNIVKADSASTPANWQWFKGTDRNNGAAKPDTTGQKLTSLTGYVLVKSVYVTIADGTPDAKNLVLANVAWEKDTAAAEGSLDGFGGVLVASSTAVAVNRAGSAADATKSTILAADVKGADDPIKLDIYVFVDGAAENIKTANVLNLATLKLKLTFKVDD